MLSSVLAILDGGLGMAASRESAGFSSANDAEKHTIVSLLRTMQTIFWFAALVAGCVVAAGAPLIAKYWLNVPSLQVEHTTFALRLMGVALMVQFPVAFYSGCLNGLQCQVRLNVINAIGATVRSAGALMALRFYAPTIEVFFIWQCIVGLLVITTLHLTLWKTTGYTKDQSLFYPGSLHRIKKFTLGVA